MNTHHAVNSVETGWDVIYQASHALLAGHLADHLDHEHQSKYWSITKAAICRHDQQERFETKPSEYVTEADAPLSELHETAKIRCRSFFLHEGVVVTRFLK